MEGIDLEKVVSVINQKYEGHVLLTQTHYDFPTVTLKSDNVVDIIGHLKNHPETKLDFLTTLCGIHYPDLNQIAVMYQLHNMVTNKRLRIKTYLSAESPKIRSLTSVFPGANWMERETYDFYGVVFEGHPNLKRILNVDEMIIFPLRKEYPLEDQVREDKNDTMFGR